MKDSRPNPDGLLAQVAHEEKRSTRGKLRLFFGMAAGVGKTYAMLKAARESKSNGLDVRIAVLETHGRSETLKMAEGLPTLPKKQISYRGTLQEEMDLDAVLNQRPALVLIDELAHTNVPGSRHEKRYQDVIEILDAGIDVYSTLNVQHLESRADVVGLITAVQIRETVPDSVLDLADQIELIDLTPQQLIERLKEGKIYPGRKTEQALQYFFQEGNLSALREISLRVTADKVERDLKGPQSFTKSGKEQLLVAVSPSPFSEKLIRTARRTVEDLEISWVAIYVDTGQVLNETQHNQLVKNLSLAEELGAQTLTLHGVDIARTLSDYAKQHTVVQMILGRPQKARLWSKANRFINDLIELNPNIDITILQQPNPTVHPRSLQLPFRFQATSSMAILFWVIATTGLSAFLVELIGYKSVGFVFLFLILLLSFFFPFVEVLIGAFLSALLWNYFFIPPTGGFSIAASEDIILVVTYFVIACASGFFTYQIKQNQRILKEREEKTQALYDILKSMTLARGTGPVLEFALRKVSELFQSQCRILTLSENRLIEGLGELKLSEKDLAVAQWSFSHGRKAGWSTDTLPQSSVLCLALKSGDEKFGVLALKPTTGKKLTPDQENLLFSIVNQMGIVLAKQKTEEENLKADLLRRSEKLHQTLLNCVSHELRTPLTAILGAATTMSSTDASKQSLLIEEIIRSSKRLNHVFENLLDVTRLESGSLNLKNEWFEVDELVESVIDSLKPILENRKVEVIPFKTPLYLNADFELLSHALSNLIRNAALYSPALAPIQIRTSLQNNEIQMDVLDLGPGIPPEHLNRLFDKFYRLPGAPAGGMGLGLSIAKSLTELQGGRIEAKNRPEGGACFSLVFPYRELPNPMETQ